VNRCAICGKFRPWAALKFCWSLAMVDIYGGISEDEWFECSRCRPNPEGEQECPNARCEGGVVRFKRSRGRRLVEDSVPCAWSGHVQ
jgi:hypothetical protein